MAMQAMARDRRRRRISYHAIISRGFPQSRANFLKVLTKLARGYQQSRANRFGLHSCMWAQEESKWARVGFAINAVGEMSPP
jgi:hypothetical protein